MRPDYFDFVEEVLRRHTELMSGSLRPQYEIWDGGVFCLQHEDVPHCRYEGELMDRAASRWVCGDCGTAYEVSDLELTMSGFENE